MRKRSSRRTARTHTHYAKKAGSAPGSIVHLGEIKVAHPDITLFDYDAENLGETTFTSIEASRGYRRQHQHLWLNVHGLHEPRIMEEVGQRFSLHPLVLEDIANTQQRPKLDEYPAYSFIALRTFRYDSATHDAISEQICLVLGGDFLLSFQEQSTGLFDPIRVRLRLAPSSLRRNRPAVLLHALIDAVVDQYFVVVEALSIDIETLEERILEGVAKRPIEEINHFRRELQEIRRAVWPLREVLAALLRQPAERIPTEAQPYFRDIYDHTIHIIEQLDAMRELIGNLFEVHQAGVANRMNAEVRVLTVVTTLLAPATLVTGFFGMNFQHIPWLDRPWGWIMSIALIVGCSLSLVVALFWRRWWVRVKS